MEAREGIPPAAGEYLTIGDLRMQIVQAGKTSVRRVRLLPPAAPDGEE